MTRRRYWHHAISRDGTGKPIAPNYGIFPLLKEVKSGELKVSGTGFYVTRYGLFLTAKHVLMDVIDQNLEQTHRLFSLHFEEDEKSVYLRPVRRFTYSNVADVALGELDNFIENFPDNPLMNRWASMTVEAPPLGGWAATYAYPENKILNFNRIDEPPELYSDYFKGVIVSKLEKNQRPFIPYPHYESSLKIMSGASGGPVFDAYGRIFALNCRGWDFDGGEHDGKDLSSLVPLTEVMSLGINNLQTPDNSWEKRQIPNNRQSDHWTIRELTEIGHIRFTPHPIYSVSFPYIDAFFLPHWRL